MHPRTIYLHYVLSGGSRRSGDLRRSGGVIIVRYADDYLAGFEHRDYAERFLTVLVHREGAAAVREPCERGN